MSKRSTWLYFSNLSAWLESRRREHGRATGYISCWGHCQHCPAPCRQSRERQEASEFGLTSQYLILGVHVWLCKGLGVGLKVSVCVCVCVCVCVLGGEDFIYLIAFSFSLSRFFRGCPTLHSELHHSKERDPHCSRYGQMEAFSGTSGICTVDSDLAWETWAFSKWFSRLGWGCELLTLLAFGARAV